MLGAEVGIVVFNSLLVTLFVLGSSFLTGILGKEEDGFLQELLPLWLCDSNLSLSDITWLTCELDLFIITVSVDEHTEIDDLGEIDADEEEDDKDADILFILIWGFTE